MHLRDLSFSAHNRNWNCRTEHPVTDSTFMPIQGTTQKKAARREAPRPLSRFSGVSPILNGDLNGRRDARPKSPYRASIANGRFAEGARLGVLIGIFVVCALVLHNYVNLNIGLKLGQAAAYFVQWTIIGIVIGLIYKPPVLR
jgi:hypothetical protein